jgi:hypothetical protein
VPLSKGFRNMWNRGKFYTPSIKKVLRGRLCDINTTHIDHVNMISSVTSRSLGSFDPWVVHGPEDVDSYGASILLTIVKICDPTIPSSFVDTI